MIRSFTVSGVPKARGDLVLELVHVERGGVDDQVGVAAQAGHHDPLLLDALEQPAAALERVRSPRGLLAAHEDVVGGLEEEQGRAPGRELRGQLRAERVEEHAGAYVDHGRDRLADALLLVDQPDHVADQLGREVVDHEVAEVLELLGGGAATGAGHAR